MDPKLVAVDLASLLEDRLLPCLPAGFRIESCEGVLRLSPHGAISEIELDLASLLSGRGDGYRAVAATCLAVLDAVQDWVSCTLKVPWPQADGTSASGAMLRPRAIIEDDCLFLLYGDRQAGVVLKPLNLTALLGD